MGIFSRLKTTATALALSLAVMAGYGAADASTPDKSNVGKVERTTLDSQLTGGTGVARINRGFNSNFAANALNDKNGKMYDLDFRLNGNLSLDLLNVINDALEVKDDINAIDQEPDPLMKKAKIENLETSANLSEIRSDAAVLLPHVSVGTDKVGYFSFAPYATATFHSRIIKPKGLREAAFDVLPDGNILIYMPENDHLLHFFGSADIGGSLAYSYPIHFTKDQALSVGIQNRWFWRNEVDYEYSLPETVNTGDIKGSFDFSNPNRKSGAGYGLDLGIVAKLAPFINIGTVLHNIPGYTDIDGGRYEDVGFDFGFAVYPLYMVEVLKDTSVAVDFTDITQDYGRFRLGVDMPIGNKDFRIAPKFGYSYSVQDPAFGHQVSAGAVGKLSIFEIGAGYRYNITPTENSHDILFGLNFKY